MNILFVCNECESDFEVPEYMTHLAIGCPKCGSMEVDEVDEMDEPNDDMDGDWDSGMASAGWGTDEDYGCYDDGDDW